MKINRLKIKNVGIVKDSDIPINQPLLVFYGECKSGKSTHLNAIKWCLGGAFPLDIIRHGEKEASVEMEFDGGTISRSWYRSKDGETKARAVQFIRNGRPVQNPVSELKRIANPFLLDQDHFRNMSELERKRFLTEQLGVDTSALDKDLIDTERQATTLRAKVAGYGEIDLTEVKMVDVSALQSRLAEIRANHKGALDAWEEHRAKLVGKHTVACAEVSTANHAAQAHNAKVDRTVVSIDQMRLAIAQLEKQLQDAKATLDLELLWLADNPVRPIMAFPNPPEEPARPEPPDTSEIEAQIAAAAAQNVKAEQYQANLAKDKQRQADAAALKALEDKIRKTRADKIALLSKISADSKIPGLTFEEDGTFVFEGTQAGMLSTSQIMRLSSLLSSLYLSEGDSFGIELLDRGESLGRSIFDYVEHAKKTNVSVLATVVGEKPARVPENVGVFCVKDGVVFKEDEAQ